MLLISPVATETKTASLVSCIIPTRNRVRMLDRAISSALAQTYPHLELIIVDDGSTDGTYQLCWDWIRRDHRVRYIRNESPMGGAGARNVGIEDARGKFVAFLDDDDEWLPGRLLRQVEALEKSGERFAFSDYLRRNRGREIVCSCSEDTMGLEKLLWDNHIGSTSLIIVDAEIARAVQFDPSLTAAQDYDFYVRVAELGVTAIHVPFTDVVINEHQGPRIGTSGPGKYKGNRKWVLKHFHRLSRSQKLFHIFNHRLFEYSNNPNRNARYMFRALCVYPWWKKKETIIRVLSAVRRHRRLTRAIMCVHGQ